ncbi:MAG TPA: hypothetical protein GX532_02340 [Clostridia bacterium]|nr:hypothetical protein [Clostridia bacterium]
MYIPKENVDPAIKEELEQVIAAQAELEKIKFLVRDDNCSEEWLEKGVLLAKTYRSAEEVAILKKMLAEAKAKGEGNFVRNKVKFKITHTILNDLASDINSGGERREKTKYASNWEKKLNLFKSELEKRGIYLDERYEGHRIHEAEIMQTWDKINEQVKNENTKARSFEKVLDEVLRKHPQIGLEYHSAVSEEQTGIKKTRNLEEYLEDAQQFAGKTVRDDGGEQISSEKRIIRYLLKTADERKQWGSDIGAK